MSIVILRFPGTNCEFDMQYAFEKIGLQSQLIWHKEESLPNDTKLVVIPGGFSYGDYLRSGAIAQFSPIMKSVIAYAKNGGLTLGICNGFQILLECGLLPGAMRRNENLHFVSKFQELEVVENENRFLQNISKGSVLNIPIAHAEGNYFIDANSLEKLYANNQVLLKYRPNPNGSVDDIAGICNEEKNVFGLMPHPERAIDAMLGSTDGVEMLKNLTA